MQLIKIENEDNFAPRTFLPRTGIGISCYFSHSRSGRTRVLGVYFRGTIIWGVTDPMKGGLLPKSMLCHLKCPVGLISNDVAN